MSTLADLGPYALLILVGVLPNEVWRVLGLWVARALDEDSEIVVLARAIATAVLTGVVGKLVIFAPGALAGVPLAIRLGATAAGFAVFLLLRGSVFAGVFAATAALIAGTLAFAA